MLNSFLYAASTESRTITSGNVIPVETALRRSGSNSYLAENGIMLSGVGYYRITSSFVICGITFGNVTVKMLINGTPVPGATASVTISDGIFSTIGIDSIVQQFATNGSKSVITFELSGVSATVTNMTVIVEKL